MNNSTLIWKKITYPEVRKDMYLISENGDVMNAITLKVLSPYEDKDGYLKVGLCCNIQNKIKTIFIHRLVAHEFVPNPNNHPVVDHLDGKKKHNHYTNLEWVTIRENTIRAELLGLRNVQGEYNGNSSRTEEEVRSICEKYEQGWSVRDVFKWLLKDDSAKTSEHLGLYEFLRRIKTKESWEYIVSEYSYSTDLPKEKKGWHVPKPQTSNFKYSEEDIHDVCMRLENGQTVISIVEDKLGNRDLSIPETKRLYGWINDIRLGRCWSSISSQYNINKSKGTERWMEFDENICKMVDAGLSKKEIRHSLGVTSKIKEPALAQRIDSMIDRYKTMKSIKYKESIISNSNLI